MQVRAPPSPEKGPCAARGLKPGFRITPTHTSAMRQDPLEGLLTFVTVAESGGFSAAAVKLGVSPSAVSQAVRQLEERVGTALFNRTTRSVSLTELGARYFERVRPALGELSAASAELGGDAVRPSGWLRLNVPRAGYLMILQPLMRRFLDAYPEVSIEIRVDNALVDIVSGGFDAGIRFGDLVEKDMVATRIGAPLSAFIVASPEYLRARGTPAHPKELLNHECVRYRQMTRGTLERWSFAKDGEELEIAVDGRFVINDSGALVQAALDGLGVVYMISSGPMERHVREGRLVRILQDWSPKLQGFTLYYPDRRRASASLRALIEFIRAELNPAQPATAPAAAPAARRSA